MYNSRNLFLQICYSVMLLWTFYSLAPTGDQVPTFIFYTSAVLKWTTLIGSFVGFAVANTPILDQIKNIFTYHILDLFVHIGFSVYIMTLSAFSKPFQILLLGITILKCCIVFLWTLVLMLPSSEYQASPCKIEFGSISVNEPLPIYSVLEQEWQDCPPPQYLYEKRTIYQA